MPPTEEQTRLIHSQYRALTGLDVPYTMTAYFLWSAYLSRGLGEPDLACMVRYIKLKIKDGRRPKESLLMANMIKDLDAFQEYLAMARAESRNSRTPDARQRVLMDAGMHKEPKTEARTVGDVAKAALAFEQFKQWRAKEGL